MKKILYILPFVALIAAGCNNTSPQTSTNTVTTQNSGSGSNPGTVPSEKPNFACTDLLSESEFEQAMGFSVKIEGFWNDESHQIVCSMDDHAGLIAGSFIVRTATNFETVDDLYKNQRDAYSRAGKDISGLGAKAFEATTNPTVVFINSKRKYVVSLATDADNVLNNPALDTKVIKLNNIQAALTLARIVEANSNKY